jgi:hypothetical protein
MSLQFRILSLTETAAALAYELHNTRDSPVFVAHVLYKPGPDGGHLLDPELAYAIPSGGGGLTLAKSIFPIPAGLKVERAEMPYFRRMEPGERLQARISVQVPVAPFDPYRMIKPAEKPTPLQRLMLRIGLIDSRRIGPRDATIRPSSHAGLFSPDYGKGRKAQEFEEAVLVSPPKELSFFNSR